jgi:crotonobetainyl-CoA:carnitine CoA-transferase CaiB-like acyl-CoA transferase
MIERADIVVENFKVGGMAALGLSYDDLCMVNPGLIYCSISGYGQSGPYRDRAGYDAVIEAEGGIMSITGPVSADGSAGEPHKVGVAIVDITAGLNAVIAILAGVRPLTSRSLTHS